MRAVFSDLDGSLRHNREGFDARDLATLVRLGEQGVARIVATGRSLYAARKVLAPDFPIDFLIFSSGAGILDWRSQTLLGSWQLQAAEAAAALDCLTRLGLDCMLHQPVPDNHHFHYRRLSDANPDFEQRLALYADFACEAPNTPWSSPCSQLLTIVSAKHTAALHTRLQGLLPGLSIIRTTSPLDGQSGWIEIFPAKVSKSQAAAWLSALNAWTSTLAFGNDYNDTDLLAWCGRAFVPEHAPPELRAAYETVADQAGFTQAIKQWDS